GGVPEGGGAGGGGGGGGGVRDVVAGVRVGVEAGVGAAARPDPPGRAVRRGGAAGVRAGRDRDGRAGGAVPQSRSRRSGRYGRRDARKEGPPSNGLRIKGDPSFRGGRGRPPVALTIAGSHSGG